MAKKKTRLDGVIYPGHPARAELEALRRAARMRLYQVQFNGGTQYVAEALILASNRAHALRVLERCFAEHNADQPYRAGRKLTNADDGGPLTPDHFEPVPMVNGTAVHFDDGDR